MYDNIFILYCFSINFQVFTYNNQHNFIITSNLLLYKKDKKQKAIVNLDQSDCRKVSSHLEIYTNINSLGVKINWI